MCKRYKIYYLIKEKILTRFPKPYVLKFSTQLSLRVIGVVARQIHLCGGLCLVEPNMLGLAARQPIYV
jgi:hypothetical protein